MPVPKKAAPKPVVCDDDEANDMTDLPDDFPALPEIDLSRAIEEHLEEPALLPEPQAGFRESGSIEESPEPPVLPINDEDTDDEDVADCPPALPPPQAAHQEKEDPHEAVAELWQDSDIQVRADPEGQATLLGQGAQAAAPKPMPAPTTGSGYSGPSRPRTSQTRADDLRVGEQLAKTRALPPPLKPGLAKQFLVQYGYDALDDRRWATPAEQQPDLSIQVNNHIEFGDHTQYEVICKVTVKRGTEVAEIAWRTLRRLKHIRAGLHDVVRKVLGSKYKNYFGGTPFALHTAPKGTTERLRGWFQSLSRCINAGGLEPSYVATSFRILDGPGTPLYASGKFDFCMAEGFDQIPVTAAMFGSKHDANVAGISPKWEKAHATAKTPRMNGATNGQALVRPGGPIRAPRSVEDWTRDQDQFSHLPPLPEGWIRVRSSTNGSIYYCCKDTLETTFTEPTEPRIVDKSLPTGWVQMTSRSTGRVYYWHALSGKSQFERPEE